MRSPPIAPKLGIRRALGLTRRMQKDLALNSKSSLSRSTTNITWCTPPRRLPWSSQRPSHAPPSPPGTLSEDPVAPTEGSYAFLQLWSPPGVYHKPHHHSNPSPSGPRAPFGRPRPRSRRSSSPPSCSSGPTLYPRFLNEFSVFSQAVFLGARPAFSRMHHSNVFRLRCELTEKEGCARNFDPHHSLVEMSKRLNGVVQLQRLLL